MPSRLFVGNLSFQVTEDELQEAFADFGGTNASIPVNELGKPRGFGFVDVQDGKVQEAVTALNGRDLHGREITVNEARPREDRGAGRPRSSTYGGGGYGGGGGGYAESGERRDRERTRGGRDRERRY